MSGNKLPGKERFVFFITTLIAPFPFPLLDTLVLSPPMQFLLSVESLQQHLQLLET
jgi:hypothetical protein